MILKTPDTDKKNLPSSTDGGFKRAVIVSTALIFAAVFGWLACIQRTEGGKIEFHWQLSALLWIAIGIVCTVYFWRQVWPAQIDSPTGKRSRLIKGWAALLIPSLMWMAYPLRFVSGQQLLNVGSAPGIRDGILGGRSSAAEKLTELAAQDCNEAFRQQFHG